jgi:hypothetical protein
MSRTSQRFLIVWSGLLALALLISLLTFAVSYDYRGRFLYFPGTIEQSLSGERRVLPRQPSRREWVDRYLRELILGPMSVNLSPMLNPETEIRALSVDRSRVYVDLSEHILTAGPAQILTPVESLEGISFNLYRAFPWLTELVLTINGHVPDTD